MSSDFDDHNKSMCISANITTIRENIYHDPTCVLDAGCHPFITNASYIIYKETRFDSENTLKKFVESGYMIPKEPVSNELLEKIIQGLQDSPHTKGYIKKLLK